MKESYVYILSNKNRTVLYVGVTSDLMTRIENHKKGTGSQFTKKYNVYDLMYFEKFNDINQAIEREKKLKNWHSPWKWDLIVAHNPKKIDLYDDLKL